MPVFYSGAQMITRQHLLMVLVKWSKCLALMALIINYLCLMFNITVIEEILKSHFNPLQKKKISPWKF